MDRRVFWWFVPVLAGMLLAIPFTVFTSRCTTGAAARRARLFLTPEETEPSDDIILLRSALSKATVPSAAEKEKRIGEIFVNPCYSALHRWLLPDSADPKFAAAFKALRKDQEQVEKLREKAVRSGLEKLAEKEKLLLLSEANGLKALHRTLWVTPSRGLAESWRTLIGASGEGSAFVLPRVGFSPKAVLDPEPPNH